MLRHEKFMGRRISSPDIDACTEKAAPMLAFLGDGSAPGRKDSAETKEEGRKTSPLPCQFQCHSGPCARDPIHVDPCRRCYWCSVVAPTRFLLFLLREPMGPGNKSRDDTLFWMSAVPSFFCGADFLWSRRCYPSPNGLRPFDLPQGEGGTKIDVLLPSSGFLFFVRKRKSPRLEARASCSSGSPAPNELCSFDPPRGEGG